MKVLPTYIALGANLPRDNCTPAETLHDALEALQERGVDIIARSSFWHSPAWPDPADPPYVNAAAEIVTELSPRALLDLMHKIEASFGRTRVVRWESRALDLDLIDYRGEVRSDADGLELPHPRAAGRAFVLLPLAEIAPDWREPVSGMPISSLIGRLPAADKSAMHPLQSAPRGAREGLA